MGTEYWNGAEAAHRRVMIKQQDIRIRISVRSHISVCLILTWQVSRDQHT